MARAARLDPVSPGALLPRIGISCSPIYLVTCEWPGGSAGTDWRCAFFSRVHRPAAGLSDRREVPGLDRILAGHRPSLPSAQLMSAFWLRGMPRCVSSLAPLEEIRWHDVRGRPLSRISPRLKCDVSARPTPRFVPELPRWHVSPIDTSEENDGTLATPPRRGAAALVLSVIVSPTVPGLPRSHGSPLALWGDGLREYSRPSLMHRSYGGRKGCAVGPRAKVTGRGCRRSRLCGNGIVADFKTHVPLLRRRGRRRASGSCETQQTPAMLMPRVHKVVDNASSLQHGRDRRRIDLAKWQDALSGGEGSSLRRRPSTLCDSLSAPVVNALRTLYAAEARCSPATVGGGSGRLEAIHGSWSPEENSRMPTEIAPRGRGAHAQAWWPPTTNVAGWCGGSRRGRDILVHGIDDRAA